jgi:hypothetical protein
MSAALPAARYWLNMRSTLNEIAHLRPDEFIAMYRGASTKFKDEPRKVSKIPQVPMLAGSLPLRTVFSGTQGGSPADILENGPCLTERQLPHEGDNSDGIVGNVKSDNYGGGGNYLSRMRRSTGEQLRMPNGRRLENSTMRAAASDKAVESMGQDCKRFRSA